MGNRYGFLYVFPRAHRGTLGRVKMRGAGILNRLRGVLSRHLLLSVLSIVAVLLPVAGGQSLQAQVPNLTFVELFHTEAEEVLQFIRGIPGLSEYAENGSVTKIANKKFSLLVNADPPTTEALIRTIRDYENLEVRDRLIQKSITIRYAGIQLVLEALAASKVCQVYHRTEEVKSDATKQGNRTITRTYTKAIYSRYDAASETVLPSWNLPEYPYILEIPHVDPVDLPPVNLGSGIEETALSLTFQESPSTESRNRLLAVGTEKDLERIQGFIDQIDIPAKQIMIEVQIIELEADALSDIGIDMLAYEKRHSVIDFASPLPGEEIPQPGENFNPIEQAGLSFIFDDTTERLSAQFLAGVHALVRKGDAIIKARPKLYALDDRQSQLHLGEKIPTFVSTDVVRNSTGGNFVENINKVGTEHIGTTLVVKPRISGPDENEVSMLVDITVNNLQGRQRVFEEDLLGIPEVATRNFRGQARVKNHRPLILGGLIKESEFETKNKIPILGEIPILGDFLGRRNSQQKRSEIIIVLTPHILSEDGIDPISTPKESSHFDTYNSVLFNDRYILKGRDLVGLDPISRTPVEGFTRKDVVDLTMLSIVKKRELVSRLKIFEDYLPDASASLSVFKRRHPEKSIRTWSKEERQVFFQAAAILVENIKSLNPDLDYQDVVSPRREIVVPTSPYHVSLSFDKLRTFYEKGDLVVLRGETVLSEKTLERLRVLGERSLDEFAKFILLQGRTAQQHGDFRKLIEEQRANLFPDSSDPSDLSYDQLLTDLSGRGIDFLAIMTYLTARLEDAISEGEIPLGTLEDDLAAFELRTVTLDELGDHLQDLDERWEFLNSSPQRPVRGL
ncbi:MAG: type II and III secretion system protein [Planctomycetota bacterium]|nr:type II and III secretion system protein [Planctomycetota bacterium]